MDEVTASMAELTGRVAALAPLARLIAGSAGSPVAKIAALAYGVDRRAVDCAGPAMHRRLGPRSGRGVLPRGLAARR